MATDSAYTNYHYYLDWHTTQRLEWTFGLSYEFFDDEPLSINDRNLDPKLGIRWSPTSSSEFRLAVSRGSKRRNASDQTLEPTALAGFNQIYDDFSGSRYVNTGVAYDQKLGSSTSTGLQLLHRQLDVPLLRIDEPDGRIVSIDESQSEAIVRGYWNRILNSALTLDVAFLYERFERDDTRFPDATLERRLPLLIETLSLPIKIHYTHLSGFFARTEISYVFQQFDQYSDTANSLFQYNQASENFASVNVSVGFIVPVQRIAFRLEINNLFDQPHRFQRHVIESDAIANLTRAVSSPRFSPERIIVARTSFSFR